MPTELERFLLARITDRNTDWIGISSNAMVAEALTGEEVSIRDYPHDLSDLSRCCATFARAPGNLKQKMLPRLLAYCEILMPEEPVLEEPPASKETVIDWLRRRR